MSETMIKTCGTCRHWEDGRCYKSIPIWVSFTEEERQVPEDLESDCECYELWVDDTPGEDEVL